MLARQLAYITYVRGSMSTLQILLFLYFYGFMPPTLSREEPYLFDRINNCNKDIYLSQISDTLSISLKVVSSIIEKMKKEKLVIQKKSGKNHTFHMINCEFIDPSFSLSPEEVICATEKFKDYLSHVRNGYSKKCAEQILIYLENGKHYFTISEIASAVREDEKKVENAMSTLRQNHLIITFSYGKGEKYDDRKYTVDTNEISRSGSADKHQAFARAAFETFGNNEFSREMIIASVDYNENSLGAVLHDLTAMKILSCREDEETRYQYRFMVNPKDNPEYFAVGTQQSFLPDAERSDVEQATEGAAL